MRILRYSLTLCLLAFFSFAAQAQLQFGGGIATVGNFDQFGIQAKGQYALNDTWRVSADFTYLFPEAGTAWEINPNAHYIFSDDGAGKKLYALAGLGIYHFGFDLGGFGNIGFTDVGLNVGAGANMPIGNMAGYAEAKFGIGGSEIGLAVGILFGN
jgi:hypothetical protein